MPLLNVGPTDGAYVCDCMFMCVLSVPMLALLTCALPKSLRQGNTSFSVISDCYNLVCNSVKWSFVLRLGHLSFQTKQKVRYSPDDDNNNQLFLVKYQFS